MYLLVIVIVLMMVYYYIRNNSEKKDEKEKNISNNSVYLHEPINNIETKLPIRLTDVTTYNNKQIEKKIMELTHFYTKQFSDYDKQTEIMLIYSENRQEGLEVINTVVRYAKRNVILKNLLDDDPTQMHASIFDKALYDYVEIMKQIYRRNDIIDNLKIYGIDICRYMLCINNYMRNKEKIENNDVVVAINKISNKFNINENEIKMIFDKISRQWNENQNIIANYELNNCFLNTWMCKKIVDDIYDELYKKGKFHPRWINEYRLYSISRKYYKDAMYQYRTNWLGQQSLDIFIPCLNIGIEYQGIQHHKQVDFFGGEEEFIIRRKNDIKKRELCFENGVSLLEWNYFDPINEINFCIKIKELIGEEPSIYADQDNKQYEINLLEFYELNYVIKKFDEEEFILAVESKNMEIIYLFFLHYIENCEQKMVEKLWVTLIGQYERKEMKWLLRGIIDRKNSSENFIKIIVHCDTLLRYYMGTSDLNYLARQIVLGMIRERISYDNILTILMFKRENYIKESSIRGFDRFLQSISYEANSECDKKIAIRIFNDLSVSKPLSTSKRE